MSRRIVLGTAGHIDHGKTSLIKALTGIDTDRLKEEKERGITIELGFAHLELADGQTIGVVDVPGHERFVRTMVAGASGVDLVLLVVAADEGIMPQTREHIDVCQVLGVGTGLTALTKVDMVEEEWLELVEEDVRSYLSQTFLKEAPLVPVSAQTGQGLEELRRTLTEICARVEERRAAGPFRLPVDRVFSMRGFGTVVTGTSISGRMKLGQTAEIFPRDLRAKVRGLQIHSLEEEEVFSGQRTAVNLQGLERQQIQRGNVLAEPGALCPALRLDVRLDLLSSAPRPLKNRASVHLHLGTADLLARVIPLGGETLEPGQSDYAQLVLLEPAVCLPGDPFVIRSYSPPLTIGGGVVLSVSPPRRKRFAPETLQALETLDKGALDQRMALLVEETRLQGASRDELKSRLGLTEKEIGPPLSDLLSRRVLVRYDKERRRFVHGRHLDLLSRRLEDLVEAFHQANPLKPGLPKEELKTRLKLHADPRVITFQVARLIEEGRLKADEELVSLAGHRISLGGETEDLKKRILSAYSKGGLSPPTVKALIREMGEAQVEDVLRLLVKDRSLVRIKEQLYFESQALADLEKRLRDLLEAKGEMTTQDFKDLTGLTRKYLIPLAEYYDQQGVTIRVGEVRRLRPKLG